MTTSIQQDELATELQELYLKSKQWISELDFQGDDLTFLKRLFGINCPLLIMHNEFDKITNVMIEAARIEENQSRIRQEISDFMATLATLIKKPDPVIGTSLIQCYNQIETDLNQNSNTYQTLKKHVFLYASEPA